MSDFTGNLKKQQNYLHSDENKVICRPFIHECQRLSEIAIQYSNQCKIIYDRLCNEVMREEHSTGGEALHRGYYCPSPTLDIVVGKGNRGRLLKRLTVNSKPIYRFGFNSNSELTIVDALHLNSHEIIIRDGRVETGIAFSINLEIETLSECVYCHNQIVSYIFCGYDSYDRRIYEYRKETYKYSKEGLTEVDQYDFLNSKNAPMLQHERYIFRHDGDGCLSNYMCMEFEGEAVKDSCWKDRVFDIRIKRKV